MRIFVFATILSASFLTGCDSKTAVDWKYVFGVGNHASLEATVTAFSKGADECLLDVRDRGLRYEASRNCAALKTLSLAYIEAGGTSPSEPSRIEAKGQSALAVAWSARAASCLGGGMNFLW